MKIQHVLTLIACIFILSSCDKDGKDKKDSYCFDLVYPIQVEFPDGIVEMPDVETYKKDLIEWYKNEENKDLDKPAILFPLDIKYEGGKIETIQSDEELQKLKKLCDKKDSFCLKLVYPVSYQMPDDSVITGDEKTLEIDLKAWYENNPDVEEKPILIYPVDVILKDESTQSVENEEAMIELKKDCE